MMARRMPGVSIRNLVVRFGDNVAVDGVTLEIAPEEMFLLLGPSGCGKTTVLRAVAGFAPPSAGSIRFGEEDVTALPAHARNAGMVFQSYALWPHKTVAENVAFGLRELRVPKPEIAERVEAALASTRMAGFGARRVDELSGGEQQRVALARALVVRPRCLLLDEPLASLDAGLRRSMREEIRRICKAFGMTTIYVTHDQKEALAVADRIGVMHRGRVLQVGSPSDIYRRPRSRAVAAFIGETNLVEARVLRSDAGETVIEGPLGTLVATGGADPPAATGQRGWVSLRPECLRLVPPGTAAGTRNRFSGRLTATSYLGEIAEHRVEVGTQIVSVFELNPRPETMPDGARDVEVEVDPADVVLLPVDDERLGQQRDPAPPTPAVSG
jgi:iron(III) transport system ATP-binding protein